MIQKSIRTVGTFTVARPPIDPNLSKISMDYINDKLDRYSNQIVRQFVEVIMGGQVGFIVEKGDDGKISIGTALSLDTRSQLSNMLGDQYIEGLKIINDFVDPAFQKTFKPIETWLDNKYIDVKEVSDLHIKALSDDLHYYNDKLKAGSHKHFTYYLVQLALKGDMFEKLARLTLKKK